MKICWEILHAINMTSEQLEQSGQMPKYTQLKQFLPPNPGFWFFLSQGLVKHLSMASNSSCLCLLSTRIISMCHHTQCILSLGFFTLLPRWPKTHYIAYSGSELMAVLLPLSLSRAEITGVYLHSQPQKTFLSNSIPVLRTHSILVLGSTLSCIQEKVLEGLVSSHLAKHHCESL